MKGGGGFGWTQGICGALRNVDDFSLQIDERTDEI